MMRLEGDLTRGVLKPLINCGSFRRTSKYAVTENFPQSAFYGVKIFFKETFNYFFLRLTVWATIHQSAMYPFLCRKSALVSLS